MRKPKTVVLLRCSCGDHYWVRIRFYVNFSDFDNVLNRELFGVSTIKITMWVQPCNVGMCCTGVHELHKNKLKKNNYNNIPNEM